MSESNTSRRSTTNSDGLVEFSATVPSVDSGELPTVEERVEEFKEKYPDKAGTIVLHESADDPRDPVKIRRDAAKHYRTEHEGEIMEGEFYPVTWARVLRSHLEWFCEVEDIKGKFGDGEDEWEVKFLNSYHPEYLEKYYAKLMGLHRSIAGGNLPEGLGDVEGEYENPNTALISRTSSGTYAEGGQRGPVDHQLERRRAYGGDGDPARCSVFEHTVEECPNCYTHRERCDDAGTWGHSVDECPDCWEEQRRCDLHDPSHRVQECSDCEPDGYREALRWRLEQLVDRGRIEDYEIVTVEEHHPGKGLGLNAGYGHDHDVVIADGELREVDFWDPIDTWVEECPGAEHDAHDYRHPDPDERPVKIRRIDSSVPGDPDVIQSAGGYLTKYLYPDEGEAHPLERPIEQLAHHAIKWATNTRRVRMSDGANAAIEADRCRQAYRDEDREQEHDHGERLRYDEGRGPEIVCAECGSGFGVDGDAETVVEARCEESVEIELEGADADGAGVDEGVRSRWADATGGARIGEDGEVESFSRPTPIKLEAYVVDGEEYPANGTGSGVEMVPVRGLEDVPMHTPLRQLEDRSKPPPQSQEQVVSSILDELAEARDPRSVESIAEGRQVDLVRVESVVEKLSQEGRIYSPDGEGYLLV